MPCEVRPKTTSLKIFCRKIKVCIHRTYLIGDNVFHHFVDSLRDHDPIDISMLSKVFNKANVLLNFRFLVSI